MPSGQKKRVDHPQLQRFLQDALSAAAGWTVVPPEIRCIGPAGAGRANWTVDVSQMDDSMRMLVAWFQARYDVDPMNCPAGAERDGVLRRLVRLLSWSRRKARDVPRCRRSGRRRFRTCGAADR